MTAPAPSHRRQLLVASLLTLASVSAACKSGGSEPEGESDPTTTEFVHEIGPDGGAVSQAGGLLIVPAGALDQSVEITIRAIDRDLSAGAYQQVGTAWAIEPSDLAFALPAVFTPLLEERSIAGSDTFTGLLARTSSQRLLREGDSIYLNQTGEIAQVQGPALELHLETPTLYAVPGVTDETLTNAVDFDFAARASAKFDLIARALDYDDLYTKDLNGNAQGACGFQVDDIAGGSLRTGCTPGIQTASIEAHADDVAFSLIPYQLPELPTPVVVEILYTISDTPEIWYHAGFMRYSIGPCWGEVCSGHGSCVEDEDAAQCSCDEGYLPDGLECVCQPNCKNRECGSDGCGGECDPGCSGNDVCDHANGICISTDSSEETSTTTSETATSDETPSTETSESDSTLESSDSATDSTLSSSDESSASSSSDSTSESGTDSPVDSTSTSDSSTTTTSTP
jgi:hypothetical protein